MALAPKDIVYEIKQNFGESVWTFHQGRIWLNGSPHKITRPVTVKVTQDLEDLRHDDSTLTGHILPPRIDITVDFDHVNAEALHAILGGNYHAATNIYKVNEELIFNGKKSRNMQHVQSSTKAKTIKSEKVEEALRSLITDHRVHISLNECSVQDRENDQYTTVLAWTISGTGWFSDDCYESAYDAIKVALLRLKTTCTSQYDAKERDLDEIEGKLSKVKNSIHRLG